jgi:hypothetical protein
MGCTPTLNLVQRIGQPSEMEEERGQDSNHSAENLHVPTQTDVSNTGRKAKINWPTVASKTVWEAFNKDVDKTLDATLARGIDKKIRAMTTIIYEMGA